MYDFSSPDTPARKQSQRDNKGNKTTPKSRHLCMMKKTQNSTSLQCKCKEIKGRKERRSYFTNTQD
jgi:hypothetical protein